MPLYILPLHLNVDLRCLIARSGAGIIDLLPIPVFTDSILLMGLT